jgi:hypothetical protein
VKVLGEMTLDPSEANEKVESAFSIFVETMKDQGTMGS